MEGKTFGGYCDLNSPILINIFYDSIWYDCASRSIYTWRCLEGIFRPIDDPRSIYTMEMFIGHFSTYRWPHHATSSTPSEEAMLLVTKTRREVLKPPHYIINRYKNIIISCRWVIDEINDTMYSRQNSSGQWHPIF